MRYLIYYIWPKGILNKDADLMKTGGKGRWDTKSVTGPLYHSQYGKLLSIDAVSEWDSPAKGAGISKTALKYCWVMYDSMLRAEEGDAIIIGMSLGKQLENALDGPLAKNITKKLDEMEIEIRDQAIVENYHNPERRLQARIKSL